MRHVWTLANAVMCLAFSFSVVVQYNDPDPVRWMVIYGAAAVIACLEIARRTPPVLPALVAAAALVWAASIAPRVIGTVPFGAMFAEFEMHDLGVEESREMYGLAIVGVWMAVVAIAAFRRRGAARAPSGLRASRGPGGAPRG